MPLHGLAVGGMRNRRHEARTLVVFYVFSHVGGHEPFHRFPESSVGHGHVARVFLYSGEHEIRHVLVYSSQSVGGRKPVVVSVHEAYERAQVTAINEYFGCIRMEAQNRSRRACVRRDNVYEIGVGLGQTQQYGSKAHFAVVEPAPLQHALVVNALTLVHVF